MSEIENKVVDNFLEHKFHKGNTRINALTCSDCFKEIKRKVKLAIHNKNFDLMGERFIHPEEAYW